VLRFLLGYPCCHDLLLCKAAEFRGIRNILPVDLAKQNVVSENRNLCMCTVPIMVKDSLLKMNCNTHA